MSRPTTIQHPLATLRQALNLGRAQLASRLGISRPALEKIERGRNVFSAALRNKVFVATGTCPGWLAHQQGPLHTADGYAMTPAELARWEAWLEVKLPAGEDQAVPNAMGGRRLGPCYRRDCCPGPERLLIHGPLDIPRTGAVAARRLQKNLQCEQRRQLCNHLVDRARGIAQRALATWDDAEKPLWELLGAMDRHFPNVLSPVTSKGTTQGRNSGVKITHPSQRGD